jgi:putative ABC transport system permease protein
VSNYHHQGLQKAIDPMIFRLRPNSRGAYSLKIESKDMASTIASVQQVWNKFFPADPFNYYFLDELFDKQYRADQLFGKVFGLFATLAIIIACFGLLGLSAYNVLQRTREIGIRKVLGASVQSILFLLSKAFLVLVLVAFVVAVPVTWFVMNKWLQDFCLSYQYTSVGFRRSRRHGCHHCTANNWTAGLESSYCESCKIFTNRMSNE